MSYTKFVWVYSMIFAQWRNCLRIYFSEHTLPLSSAWLYIAKAKPIRSHLCYEYSNIKLYLSNKIHPKISTYRRLLYNYPTGLTKRLEGLCLQCSAEEHRTTEKVVWNYTKHQCSFFYKNLLAETLVILFRNPLFIAHFLTANFKK